MTCVAAQPIWVMQITCWQTQARTDARTHRLCMRAARVLRVYVARPPPPHPSCTCAGVLRGGAAEPHAHRDGHPAAPVWCPEEGLTPYVGLYLPCTAGVAPCAHNAPSEGQARLRSQAGRACALRQGVLEHRRLWPA